MKKKYTLKCGPRGYEREGQKPRSTFKPKYPSPVLQVMEDLKRLTERSGGIEYQFDYLGYKPLDHIT